MEIKRKTNILIKTERKLVVRQSQTDVEIRCEKCVGQMITAQTAAVQRGISTREIYRLVEEDKITFVETEAKIVYICPNCINFQEK